MMHKRLNLRKIAIPLMLLIPLLWAMAGCFYFPTFEHREDDGPNIRALVGEENDTHRPIRLGHVTRAQVIALLGEPKYISDDNTAIGYITHTSAGAWVWPLCFAVEAASDKAYAVRLVFDRDNILIGYDWADQDLFLPPLSINYTEYGIDAAVIDKLNKTGKVLHQHIQPATTQDAGAMPPLPAPPVLSGGS